LNGDCSSLWQECLEGNLAFTKDEEFVGLLSLAVEEFTCGEADVCCTACNEFQIFWFQSFEERMFG
jgi:hypothetical protein